MWFFCFLHSSVYICTLADSKMMVQQLADSEKIPMENGMKRRMELETRSRIGEEADQLQQEKPNQEQSMCSREINHQSQLPSMECGSRGVQNIGNYQRHPIQQDLQTSGGVLK